MEKNKYPRRFRGPVVMTLVTLGPTGWFFIDWFSQNYDKLPVAFVAALLCTILATIYWMNAIGCNWDDEELDGDTPKALIVKIDKYPGRIRNPVVMTLITLGLIGLFFMNWSSQSYDKVSALFVASLLCAILATIFWMIVIRPPKWKWVHEDEDLNEDNQGNFMVKKDKCPGRISTPVVMTLVTLGPIGWFFINCFSQNYGKLPALFVVSLLCVILSTIYWMNAIWPPKRD